MEILRRWCSHLLCCVKLQQQQQQQQQQQPDDCQLYFPNEITDEILSRLPVKSILKLRPVSKLWLSRISNPSFINLQLTHATTALFIPAMHMLTDKILFFSVSATDHGGSVTHLETIDSNYSLIIQPEHLNGLVLLNVKNTYLFYSEAIVVNPSTRKMLRYYYGAAGVFEHARFFFGFDESTNKHKIMRMVGSTPTIEVMILSLSDSDTWRKINTYFDTWQKHLCSGDIRSSVCVNSVIYLMLPGTLEILAFDLRTDTFSIVKVPLDEYVSYYLTIRNYSRIDPYLMKINGCIGVVCLDRVVETNKIHIWILKDYENRNWVKETVVFPEPWNVLGSPTPLDSVSTDEIIFSVRKVGNVISVPIYNMKSGCFKSVNFTLDHPLLCSPSLCFFQIICYLESVTPLLVT